MSKEPGILPEPIPFGKYYLLERISVGGMAEIFKAKAFGVEGFERLLAVKKILASIAEDESFIEMFIDEAKIAGQLNHPNIAQIFDLGKVDGSYFIALEYISGKDMKTIFERARRVGEEVDIPQVCHVVMKVCEGLEHAHNKTDSQGRDLNIVHRDISPQNILISYEGEVKIIDFGIAKAQGKTSQTQVGVLKGKFSYMSPEQVRGLHVDHRSDIFSLGIVLYEMLTLERLFLGESDFDTLEKIRKVEMSPPSLYNPNIPEELEDIVLKALAQNPDERFQSAGEFAHALERFMRNQDYYYKNTDLAGFMKEAFSEDIEFEQKKLEYYKSLDLKPPDQLDEGDDEEEGEGGLVWDEEEMETQIFDKSGREAPPAPDPGATSQPASQPNQPGQASQPSQRPQSRQSGNMEAVEVVGPDDQVDVVGPDDQVDAQADEDGAATVEYDRGSVEDELQGMSGSEMDGGQQADDSRDRRKEPTAQMSIDEQAPSGRSESRRPGGGDSRRDSPYRRAAIIGGTATVVVVAALAIIYNFAGGWFDNSAQIQFETTPRDVEILIDGKEVHDGETPFAYAAEPGPTEIVIRRDGYKADKRSQKLVAGKTYRLDAQLEEAEARAQVAVSSTPSEAKVKVDGEAIDGTTPVTAEELEAGEHEIVVDKEGYQKVTKTVELDQAGEQELDVELTPEQIALTVESDPEGARFELEGEESGDEIETGRTPETIEELAPDQTYTVTIDKEDYEAAEKTFEPGTKREETISAELEEDPETTVAANDPEPEPEPEPDPPANPGASAESGQTGTGGDDTPEESGSDGPTETAATETTGGNESESQETKQQPEPTGTSTLNISSRPAAKVHIDGKDTGQYTPLLNYEIKSGKHEIKLTNEEFGLDKTYYVDLEPGESKKIINRSK